jgi:hypothetical protein
MSKIVRISESEIVRLVKKIVKEQKYTTGRKPIKEDEDEYYRIGRFSIVSAGAPINEMTVVLHDDDTGENIDLTLDLRGFNYSRQAPVIVDFFSFSDEIDDMEAYEDEVKTYFDHMVENGALARTPDYIDINLKNGKIQHWTT